MTESISADLTPFLSLDQLQFFNYLKHLDDHYHHGMPLVPDQVYDALVEIYERRFGPYLEVGAPPRAQLIKSEKLEKVRLPFYLGSLRKIKTPEELERWSRQYPGPYVVEDKADGVTWLYYQGKLYTRGGGTEGLEISHLLQYLSLPKSELPIRGEAVITKESFQRIGRGFANPRNMIAGISNRKEINPELVKEIKFLAYQILNSPETPEAQILRLRGLGFETPWAGISENLKIADLELILAERKRTSPYEIDGLVIYQNQPNLSYPVGENPKQVVAYKGFAPSMEVLVRGVEWSATKDKLLIPVVVYEPVFLSGGTLERASGAHAKFIIENKIGPGARVRISRRGETIPHIEEVISPAKEPDLPDPKVTGNYYYNNLDLVLYDETPEVSASRIEHFVNTLEIQGLGPGRIQNLVKFGVKDISTLLQLTPEQLSKIPGIGSVLSKQIWSELKQKTKNVPLPRLIAASNIFPGFGIKRAELIVEAIPNVLDLAESQELPKLIAQLPHLDLLGQEFAKRLPEFIKWLKDHPMISYVIPQGPTESQFANRSKIQGLTVVFSGFRDKLLESRIVELGGKVTNSVSRSTGIVVVKDLDQLTSKIQKAQEYRIPILKKEDFILRYLN